MNDLGIHHAHVSHVLMTKEQFDQLALHLAYPTFPPNSKVDIRESNSGIDGSSYAITGILHPDRTSVTGEELVKLSNVFGVSRESVLASVSGKTLMIKVYDVSHKKLVELAPWSK